MSLLMQALKKAEKSKQKQNDASLVDRQAESLQVQKSVALPEVATAQKMTLSLDIDDFQIAASNNLVKELEKNAQDISVADKPSMMELSLTPHQDGRVESVFVENESTELDEFQTKKENVDPLASMDEQIQAHAQKIEPSLPENVRQEVGQKIDVLLAPASVTLPTHAATTDVGSTKTEISNEIKNNEFKKEAEELEQLKKQIVSPKIDVEQKQWAAQANLNRQLDQEKAKAVFSSKTPSSSLRLKWLSIIVIAVVVVLLGFAYMVWQKTSVNHNQFPVAPPLAAADNSLPSQDVVASSDALGTSQDASGDKANVIIDQTANINSKIEEDELKENNRLNQPISAHVGNANKEQQKPANSTKIETPISTNNAVALKNRMATQDKFSANDAAKNNATKNDTEKNESIKTASKKSASKMVNDPNTIEIRKGSTVAKVNPSLVSAYQAYIAGDRQLAVAEYQKVLQQEPNNRDALLGLAAVALNQRQAEQAGEYYGKLLNLDPNDADAIAGLTSLQQGDPVQSESRLKATLNQNPNAGAILFALGNLYAQQSRWSDAQQTYFRAYANTPTNADYAFNLAISLDRLNQRKLAIEYYQRALNLAKAGPGNFNTSKVQQRLQQLEVVQEN